MSDLAPQPPPGSGRSPASLVGREDDFGWIEQTLAGNRVQLLTLTGPGGVGKSRLALAVLDRVRSQFPDGVATVMLSDLRDPNLLLPAIAGALDSRDDGSLAVLDRLKGMLAGRRVLLLLDNFEHLGDDGARQLAGLLRVATGVRVLVTSRVPLRISGEQEFAVTPLELPRPGETDLAALAQLDSIRLFLQRARAVRPDFDLSAENAPAIAEICRRLDGLPLAIELAAARCKVLSPQALLARLSNRLRVLTGGPRDAPSRQRTMSDAIAWSYDLLEPSEQALFRRLSVFVGGFTLDGAEAVCAADQTGSLPDVLDGLVSLVDKSLVRLLEQDGESRYSLLETIQEYGLERLEAAGEDEIARLAHADWCIAFAGEQAAHLNRDGQQDAFRQLHIEVANLRGAFAWLEARRDAERLLLLASAWFYWFGRSLREGRHWTEQALALATAEAPADRRAFVQIGYATICHYLGDDAAAIPAIEASRAAWTALGDPGGISASLLVMGFIEEDGGRYEIALDLLEQAVEQCRLAKTQGLLTTVDWIGSTPETLAAWIGYHLGVVHWGLGNAERANAVWEEGLSQFRAVGHVWGVSTTSGYLGLLAATRGELVRAARYHRLSLDLRWAIGTQEDLIGCFSDVAMMATAAGDSARAARLFGAIEAQREFTGGAWRLPEKQWYEEAQREAKRKLGDDTYAREFAAGRKLTTEQAVDETSAAIDIVASGAPAPAAPQVVVAGNNILTPREIDVLRLLAAGRTDPGHRGATLYLAANCRHPRRQHPGQARCRFAGRRGRVRLPLEPGLIPAGISGEPVWRTGRRSRYHCAKLGTMNSRQNRADELVARLPAGPGESCGASTLRVRSSLRFWC